MVRFVLRLRLRSGVFLMIRSAVRLAGLAPFCA
jgi:hypothetical protein